MTTHINKVHHVTTITQAAKDLGEDEGWLREIAIEMEASHSRSSSCPSDMSWRLETVPGQA
ncbi:hypothetical protein [Bradyrhizobium cosmicum]|uniref:hypothetical protein n=1 Tax=Bradyrhizobium cosmicum TaxID=1404864 RepID=UPI0039658C1B